MLTCLQRNFLSYSQSSKTLKTFDRITRFVHLIDLHFMIFVCFFASQKTCFLSTPPNFCLIRSNQNFACYMRCPVQIFTFWPRQNAKTYDFLSWEFRRNFSFVWFHCLSLINSIFRKFLILLFFTTNWTSLERFYSIVFSLSCPYFLRSLSYFWCAVSSSAFFRPSYLLHHELKKIEVSLAKMYFTIFRIYRSFIFAGIHHT